MLSGFSCQSNCLILWSSTATRNWWANFPRVLLLVDVPTQRTFKSSHLDSCFCMLRALFWALCEMPWFSSRSLGHVPVKGNLALGRTQEANCENCLAYIGPSEGQKSPEQAKAFCTETTFLIPPRSQATRSAFKTTVKCFCCISPGLKDKATAKTRPVVKHGTIPLLLAYGF